MSALATARRRAAHSKPPSAESAQRRSTARPDLGMPAYMQKKMRVSEPGDALEGEADRVADHVTRGGATEGTTSGAHGAQRAADEKKQDSKAGGGKDSKPAAGGKDAKPAAGGKDSKDAKGAKGAGKDEKGGDQKAKPSQQPEKKEAARKEVNADDKVEKAKEKQAKEEESKAKGKDEGEKPEVQKKAARPVISRVADGAVSREAAGGASAVASDTESRIDATRGGGRELPEQERSAMESGFGEDFSAVRIHDDAAADGLARDLDARAFTVGNDVYFAQGQYAPENAEGRHLLAHELTHVVQQGGAHGAQRQVARDGGKPAAGGGKPAAGGKKGKITGDIYEEASLGKVDKGLARVELAEVTIPVVKQPFTPAANCPLSQAKRKDGAPTQQMANWMGATAKEGSALDSKIQSMCNTARGGGPQLTIDDKPVFYLQVSKGTYVMGSKKSVLERCARPAWSRSGRPSPFEIDHKQELQLGGEDNGDNLWLLQKHVNQASGRDINAEVTARVNSLIDGAMNSEDGPLWKNRPGYDSVRYGANRSIQTVNFKGGAAAGPEQSYTKEDVVDSAVQMTPLKALTNKQVSDAKLAGTPDEIVITSTAAGGKVLRIPTKGKGSFKLTEWLRGVDITAVALDEKSRSGTLSVEFFRRSKMLKPVQGTLTIVPQEGVAYGGTISSRSLGKELKGLGIDNWSPIELSDAELTDGGLSAAGTLNTTVSVLDGLGIEIGIEGDELYISKTFTADDFKIPGPIKVTSASATLIAGAGRLEAKGQLGFEVQGLGTGKIVLKGGTEGLSFVGTFDAQTERFSKFSITVGYDSKSGKITGSGDIAVVKGKIAGVEAASAKIAVDGTSWTAAGTLTPTVKALKEVSISAAFAEGAGFTFTGKAVLGDIPSVSGGDITVTLAQAGDGWNVTAKGSVDIAAPGLEKATATVSYDKGVFTAEVTVGYGKGRLKGNLTVGVTNQPRALPVPADAAASAGAPVAPPSGSPDQLTLYGAGSVSIQITPWLKGTVGIALLPNGDTIVTGEVALGEIELVPAKSFDKQLFSIGIDIPIVGVSFAGQRIGIFATVGGGASFKAGIGPVTLRNTALKITYSPQHEENTKVNGTAQVYCPASAGLRLSIHGGVGAGIPIISATVGLELGGEVGIKGAASLDITVDWGPQQPFSFTTTGKLEVKPTFKLDLSAFAKVEADLLLKTITLYEERWQLAGYEIGSDAMFSVEFPVNYTEGKGLDLDLDKITVKAPEIDPIETVKQMIG